MNINKIENTLTKLAKILNDNNITWALGGSLLIHYHNIKTDIHDIDVLVDINDYKKLTSVLSDIPHTYMEPNNKYSTKHFYSLVIDNVDIDIMLGFEVNTESGKYAFPFSKENIVKEIQLNNESVFLSSLEEWNKAYQAMNRLDKIKILKGFFN